MDKLVVILGLILNLTTNQELINDVEAQKIAFVENLYIAGNFSLKNISSIIAKKDFIHINLILEKSGAYSNKFENFNAKYLIENLFKNSNYSNDEILDIFAQIITNPLLKYNDYKRENFRAITINRYQKEYIENSKILNLYNEIIPKQIEYDEVWINSASKEAIEIRMNYLKKFIDKGLVKPNIIKLLAGERELMIEHDTKKYILELAKIENIKFDENKPFILRDNGLHYLNYKQKENRRLTETNMIKERYRTIFGYDIDEKNIIDSQRKNNWKPNTYDTGFDAVNDNFAKNILSISNQPHILRQSFALKRGAKDKLGQLKLDNEIYIYGIGPKSNSSIDIIHLEFIKLFIEKYYVLTKS